MARNTQHLAPSNRFSKSRLKTYSGRDGTASLNRPTTSSYNHGYSTYKLGGDHGNTKVRSGAASQKEYLDASSGRMTWSQSKQDKVKEYRRKNKSKK